VICARCLAEGRPLYPEIDELSGKPGRAAAAAVTVQGGTALCFEHLDGAA
jgi:hypothetical protein